MSKTERSYLNYLKNKCCFRMNDKMKKKKIMITCCWEAFGGSGNFLKSLFTENGYFVRLEILRSDKKNLEGWNLIFLSKIFIISVEV